MSYIGNPPVVNASRLVYEETALTAKTAFTPPGGYTVGQLEVYINGSQLMSDDFTATDGSTVNLTTACAVGDGFKSIAYGNFSVANAYTQTQADARFAHLTGAETLAGDKTFSGIILPQAGIKFPAAQFASSDANTLDDYEEGTFTPILTLSGTQPSAITYGTRGGEYVKVGKQVFISVYFEISSRTGGSGDVYIAGFPFAAATPLATNAACGSCLTYNVTAAGNNQIQPWVDAGNTGARFGYSNLSSGSGWGILNIGNLPTGLSAFRMNVMYTTT